MITEPGIGHHLEALKKLMPELTHNYGVKTLGIFGSYVRKQQRADSDLDLLVTFTEPPSLFRFIELENYLGDTLGVKVDLVMTEALKPAISRRILQEVIPV